MAFNISKIRRKSRSFSSLEAQYISQARKAMFPGMDFDLYDSSDSSLDWEDVLEKKIEDLSRQLASEKQLHRKEKIQVSKLQKELARMKSDRCQHASREIHLRDAEQERQLRQDAEKKLFDMTVENQNTHSRLLTLQGQFKKMEDMVASMMLYKTKIDQLKQEKSSLSLTYESNLCKYRSHISNLERENIMLMNDVRRFETQMDGKTDDRSKLLMERLKMLEAENSSLVLENEQQRQQYEKCLDEIANQVVQALLAQKTLREECVKLQKRVQDLEGQNQELSHLFQKKILANKEQAHEVNIKTHHASSTETFDMGVVSQVQVSTSISSLTQSMQLSPMSQYLLQNTVAQRCLQQKYSPENMEVLHSICSDNAGQSNAGQPGLQSKWINDKLLPGQRSRSSSSPSDVVSSRRQQNNEYCQATKIETEFPATPSSPKMTHVNVSERSKTQRSLSTSALQAGSKIHNAKSSSSLTRTKMANPSKSVSNVMSSKDSTAKNSQTDVRKSLSHPENMDKVITPSSSSTSKISSRSVKVQMGVKGTATPVKTCSVSSNIPIKRASKSQPTIPQANVNTTQTKVNKKNLVKSDRNVPESCAKGLSTTTSTEGSNQQSVNSNVQVKHSAILHSTNKVLTKLDTQETVETTPSAPLLPREQYFYDYSDEDSDINYGRPISTNLSNNSIVSLNELLEGDDTDTLLDEDITAETFQFLDSPSFMKSSTLKENKDVHSNQSLHKKVTKSSSLGSKPDIVKDTMNCEMKKHSKSPHMGRRKLSLSHQGKKKMQNQRPSSLILARDKMYQDHSSSSPNSTDSDENWSPRLERKNHPRHRANRKSTGSSSSNRSSYQSHKSSQELTPVALDTNKVINSDFTSGHKVSENETVSTNIDVSIESLHNSSLTRNKGPPPPVPKKPMSGKKSPGIRMGIQSSGIRQNKSSQFCYVSKDTTVDTSLLIKPHEFTTESAASSNLVQQSNSLSKDSRLNQNSPKPNSVDSKVLKTCQKYSSSDSSFESKNNDKVERSGSKDDGYSTMSSDILPEVLEKYSDVTQTESIPCDKSESNSKSKWVMTVSSESSSANKSSPSSVSDLDPMLESDTMSSNFIKSSLSLSSLSSLKSPKSPTSTSSEERAAKFGSLGRVKAMKLLFEAENQKSNDEKISKFPLRKSPSVDSSLGHKTCDIKENSALKRRSLGEDFKIQNNEENKDCYRLKEIQERNSKLKINDAPEFHTQKVTEKKKFEPQHRPTLKPNIPDKPPSFQPLHLSEENFLSDIPEERDEGEVSTNSSANHLEISLRMTHPSGRRLEILNMCKVQPRRKYWKSLHGLPRAVAENLEGNYISDKSTNFLSYTHPHDKSGNKPLERSMSLNDLHQDDQPADKLMKMFPRLRHRTMKCLDELRITEQVQDIVKAHILQQISFSAECQSEDDLKNLSFSQLLENRKVQQMQHAKFQQNLIDHSLSSQFSILNGNRCMNDQYALFLKESDMLFSSEDKLRRCRESSVSSNEGSLNQDLDPRFRNDYYSLCTVDSSKASSVDGDADQSNKMQHTCKETDNACRRCVSDKNTQEFEEISRQLANLSKTVNALHHSLSSLNSHDSDTESNEDRSHMFTAPSSDFRDNEGYQWEEDEFYLTPCGGEIITGSSPFSKTGACVDWVNEYVDDTSCNDEFEFFGHLPSANENSAFDMKKLPPANDNGTYDFQKLCTSIMEGDIVDPATGGTGEERSVLETGPYNNHTNRQLTPGGVEIMDPKVRAAMLDSMMQLSGGSMDSLDDNIGVDHVMCSRLIGRGDKAQGAVRSTVVPRPTVDLSRFYTRFGESEQEAVAAFDFLNDISTSPETSQQDIQPQISQSQPLTQLKGEKTKSDSKISSDKKKVTVSKEKLTNHKLPVKTQEMPLKQRSLSGKYDSPSKAIDNKKQAQGLDNSDTSKKGTQGLVNSISRLVHGKSSVTNVKGPKVKAKDEKPTSSKLPRKFVPNKEKSKPKTDSKIPKPSKH